MGDQAQYQPLIDVLYRDRPRIESLCAQHFGGLTRSVEASSGLSATSGSDVGGGLPILRASIAGNETSSSSYTRSIDPHDQPILDFMCERGIEPYRKSLASLDRGRILLLHGQLIIRDYQAILNALPIVTGALIAAASGQEPPRSKKSKKNQTPKRSTGGVAEIMGAVAELMPRGLEIELATSIGEVVLGSLKPDGLAESPQDLLRIYGTRLPGSWYALGIVEPSTMRTEDCLSAPDALASCSELRQSADQYAEAIRGLFDSSERQFTMSPILVYREVL